jgi:NAD dependent epimerase/dehydratase family enzyme
VRVLSVVAIRRALHTGCMAGDARATNFVRRVPARAARFVLGPILAEEMRADAVFSNIRLRGIGFRFRYPTLDEGLRQILEALGE